MKVIAEAQTSISHVSLRDDGIIKVEIQPEKDFEIEDAHEISLAIAKLGGVKRYPILIIPGEHTTPTLEAREFNANEKSNKYISAEAYVLKSFDQKIVSNFYLNHEAPARPTRMFETEEEAVEWLKEFVE